MNSIKNIVKHFWFSFRDLSIPTYKGEEKKQSLVIVRLDAIGDYILFRNFIASIRQSKKYNDYHITLIGNLIWKPIAEEFDSEWIDRFIWVDPKKFHKEFDYRKSVLKEIEDTGYSILFHPTFSRDVNVSEGIAKRINAEVKIASYGDRSNTTGWQKKQSDSNYNRLIPIPEDLVFEFEKNKLVSEVFINEDCLIKRPKIDKQALPVLNVNSSKYIILFIGGSTALKKWDIRNWKTIIKYLLANYPQDIIIAGGPEDIEQSLLIEPDFSPLKRVQNLVGKTSINQLLTLISRATFMISNETSAPHMAVSLDIPVIVIANASHFGRFTPYPETYTSRYEVVFPLKVDLDKPFSYNVSAFSAESTLSINSIEVDRIYPLIQKILS